MLNAETSAGTPQSAWRALLTALALICSTGIAGAEELRPAAFGELKTIPALNVARYMGTWHEIAKYPNRFQRNCTGDTRAEYRLESDGRVQVTNRCRIASGESIEAIGQARQLGPGDSPKLQVRFAPAWLAWLPFVWGNYWIIDLDEHYRLVAVSEPNREYLWILARTPTVSPKDYKDLLARLANQGFDLDRLEVAGQE